MTQESEPIITPENQPKTLENYIQENGKIVSENIDEETMDGLIADGKLAPRDYCLYRTYTMIYLDENNNLVEVKINLDKITEDLGDSVLNTTLLKRNLADLNFNFCGTKSDELNHKKGNYLMLIYGKYLSANQGKNEEKTEGE